MYLTTKCVDLRVFYTYTYSLLPTLLLTSRPTLWIGLDLLFVIMARIGFLLLSHRHNVTRPLQSQQLPL